MARDVARDWMWSEAVRDAGTRRAACIASLFRPVGVQARQPAWEPPVDILETEHEVLVLVALPGVDADAAQAVIEDGELVIAGTRVLPSNCARRSFIGSNCRKAVFTGGCGCRPAATRRCAAPRSRVVWSITLQKA